MDKQIQMEAINCIMADKQQTTATEKVIGFFLIFFVGLILIVLCIKIFLLHQMVPICTNKLTNFMKIVEIFNQMRIKAKFVFYPLPKFKIVG